MARIGLQQGQASFPAAIRERPTNPPFWQLSIWFRRCLTLRAFQNRLASSSTACRWLTSFLESPTVHAPPHSSSAVRLIALTGHGQQEDLDRSRAGGFAAHLVKPIELRQLLDLLEPVAGAAATPEA